jgi:general stress protein YciG
MANPVDSADVEKALKQHLQKLGSKGGKTRAKTLTPEELSEQGRKAGKASGAARRRKAAKQKAAASLGRRPRKH